MTKQDSEDYQGILVVMSGGVRSAPGDRDRSVLEYPIVFVRHVSSNDKAPPSYCAGMASPAFMRKLGDYFAFDDLIQANEGMVKGTLSLSTGKKRRLCYLGFVELFSPMYPRKILRLESLTRAPREFEDLHSVGAIFNLRGLLGSEYV